MNGGRGDDYIGIIGTGFTSVNGGEGWNTLVFESSDLTLDLSKMGLRVQGFAQFDLNNQSNHANSDPRDGYSNPTSGNTLALRLSDVLSQPNGAVGPNSQHMTILGDGTSTVQLDGTSSLAGSNWVVSGQQSINGVAFDVYYNTAMDASTSANLLIQQGVHVI